MKVASVWISGEAELDGAYCRVSDDMMHVQCVPDRTLQKAIDFSSFSAESDPVSLNNATLLAPLPRAFQFLDGSAYVNHVELVRKARGAQMPDSFWTDPLMYQGLSVFAAPNARITGETAWGIDFEAEIAVITRAVPHGITAGEAADHIGFVMLLNDVSLRNLIPAELSKGFGFVQSKPICACAPIAVSPGELPGWDGRKLNGILNVNLNGQAFGRADAGVDMTFDFGDLIAHAAKTRDLPAGTVIGSGTVSNKLDGGPGKPVAQGGAGYSCIAEQRMIETIETGAPVTPFLKSGDHVEIWMEDDTGQDIFGRISQKVEAL